MGGFATYDKGGGVPGTTVYADNVDFTGTGRTNTITTNGQLLIGASVANAGGNHINVGHITSPDSSLTIGYSNPNITLTNALGSGRFPITPFVVGPIGQAGYQTIQAGLNAANIAGGGIVYVQPGTYTENLTLYGNTQVVGVPGNSDSGTTGNTVIITGVHIPPSTGSFTFSNIRLVSATHIFSSAVAGSASLIVENSFIVITDGYLFNVLNWTGSLVTYSIGDGSTNNGMVNNTGGATCFFVSATHGAGTAQTMVTSGIVQIENVVLNCPWNAQTGSIISSDYNIYTHTVTCSNNSTGHFRYDSFSTGATPCLTHSSSAAIELDKCYINSSNNPSITGAGAGTLTITDTSFINNKLISTTLTTVTSVLRGGNYLSQYVVAKDGTAPYKIIQNALDAASTYFLATGIPQTVYVKPGSYTENLTLYNGVDLCAAGGQVDSRFTLVTGSHVLPASGTTAVYGIWFFGTTSCFTGSSGNAKVNMFNVITEISGSGYTFDINGYSGELNIFDYLQYDTGTNGFVNNSTGGAEVNIIFAGIGLTQNSSATAQISGNSFFQGMLVSINMNFVGTSSTQINMGCELQGTISTANTASVDIANTYFYTGTLKAINHLSSGIITLSNIGINSSNVTPIDGTGTIKFADITFLDGHLISPTITQNTVSWQPYSRAIAATDATKVGTSAFDSSRFTVDNKGFVSTNGSGIGETITGDTGGALSPTAGNWNLLGTGSITTSGAGSTLTTQLTGLTNHAVLVGAGTATITKVGPTATAGQVLQSAGAAADPAFSTATYPLTTTVSQILYSSSTNTVVGLATANSATLVTTSAGVPVFSGTMTNGQMIIGSTGATPAAGTITSTSGTITVSVGAGTLNLEVAGGGFTWTDVTGATQTLAVENGYVTDRGAGVTYTLPATAVLGAEILIVGKLGLATIAQNANQQILISSSSSTAGVGGSVVATNVGDCISLICITAGASTVWRANSLVGNWTVT